MMDCMLGRMTVDGEKLPLVSLFCVEKGHTRVIIIGLN